MDIDPSEFERDEIELGDGEHGRIYFHENLAKPYLSVTTVTNTRIDPEKDGAIGGWREKYDGTTDYKSPHWAERLYYKQKRGTLAHWAVLSQLADVPKSIEEREAEAALKNWAYLRPAVAGIQQALPAAMEDEYDIPTPNGDLGHYNGEPAWEQAMRDINYFCNTFTEIWESKGLTSDAVLDAETYVVESEYGYAGQFDLLYEDTDGDVVLADLKTSKVPYKYKWRGAKMDHKLQLAAYAYAHDVTVDRVELIDIWPDGKRYHVDDSDEWGHTLSEYQYHFLDLVNAAQKTKLADYEMDF